MQEPRDDAFWHALAESDWRRVKWRKPAPDATLTVCCAYGTPIHFSGTYYLRPAYTDGARWLCQQAYKEMCRRTGKRISNRYSQFRDGTSS